MAATFDLDVAKAKEIWSEYERTHDLSGLKGQAAGINPGTGDVYLGKSMADIVQQRWAEGDETPLYFVRIGYQTYFRKGRRP